MGTLYFPNLDLSFKLNETMLHIGPLEIKWYGAIIAVGFLLAFIYTYRRIDKFGLAQNDFLDVLIGAVVGGVVGARLYYVIFSWDYYSQNLGAIFNIRGGGLAIYGGIIGGFLVALLMCKIKKIKFLPFADLAVGGLFIGQAIGRWGNFVNMEAFGTNTDLPWGMTSARIQTYLSSHLEELTRNGMDIHPMEPVHPTFLYESLVCVIGFLILFFYLKHRRFDGGTRKEFAL